MTSANYGGFNSLLSLGAIVSAPVSIIHIVFSRFIVKLSVSGLGQVKKLLMVCFKGIVLTSGSLFCLGLISLSWLQGYLHLQDPLPLLFMLGFVCTGLLYPLLSAMLEGLHRFTFFGFGTVTYSVIRFLGALVFVALLGLGVNGAFLAIICSALVATTYGFWGLKDLFKVEPKDLPPGLFGEMGRYSLPVIISSAMIIILVNLDIVLVRHYNTPDEAGLYSVASVLGRVSFVLPATLLTVLFPTAAKAHAAGKEQRHILWVSFGLTALFGGGIALVFFIFPEQLISLLFGNRYLEAAPLLQVISIAMALLASVNVIFSYQLARSEYSYLWVLTGGATFMLGSILFYHDSAMTIAKILLVSTGIILIGTVLLYAFRANPAIVKRYVTSK